MSETIRRADLDHVHEIIPGRLWQSGSRVSWTEARWCGIDAIVAVGGEQQPWLEALMEEGWKAVRPGAPRLPVFVHMPLIDATGMLDRPTAETAAALVVRLIRDGRSVLVHCDAGVYRSVFICALVLAEIQGIDRRAAYR